MVGSPVRKALTKKELGKDPLRIETSRKVARKQRRVARKQTEDEDEDGKKRMESCTRNESLCLMCDNILDLRAAGVINVRTSCAPPEVVLALQDGWEHRGIMCCSKCAPSFLALLDRFTSMEGLDFFFDLVEAGVDRDFYTGQAVSQNGYAYVGWYSRRTCKVHFDFDATSRRIR